MQHKWLAILILAFVLLIIPTVSSTGWASSPEDAYSNLDNALNSTSLLNTSDNFNKSLNESKNVIDDENVQNASQNVMISGNVIRCDSGFPFSGVNIALSDLSGNEIAKTQTDKNGNYNFNFNHNDISFKVTASYPGHVTLFKIINLNSNNGILTGTANFQLGPEPAVTITAPSSQFLNETFNFSLSFNNTGNETGFGPIIQLILPPQIQFNGATFLGSPVGITNVGVFPGNSTGTLTDPLSGLNVTGTSGYRLYILEYPLGSFTNGQPNAVIDVNALLLGNSTLGVPLNITAYPVFRFGANETGNTPLRGNVSTAQVTPTIIKITKSSDAPEDETATGKNFPHTYTLILDIANGQTVSPVNIRDIIPKNLQFLKIISADGGAVMQQPSNSTPGGNLWIQFGSITGVLGADKIITYQLYAPKYDNTTLPVLDNVTGATVNATNTANATGTYNSIPVSASDDYTIYLKSLAIQKGVTDTSTDPIQPKPTDVLKYDLNFQISDYFSMNNLVIHDTLGDGQTFLTNSSYIPRLVLHLPPGFGPSQNITLNFNLTNLNQFQMIHDNATGITYLTFNITQLLIDNGYTGILEGGNYTGTDHGATQGTLTFWSQIDINYQNPPNHPIVSKDTIDNNVQVNANLTNSGNNVTDNSGTRVVIVAPTAQKSIAYIKRNGQFIPITNVLLPGDEVTFLLHVDVPTNNLEDFYLIDYLPIPLFRATQFTNLTQDTLNNPPLSGRWTFGPNNSLTNNASLAVPILSIDPVQNTLKFYYGSVYNCTQPNNVLELLFTVTATGDPFVDGLYLTNLLNVKYNNTFNDIFCDNKIVSFQIGAPVLNIVKTANPTSNLQAGSVVNYTITISNTGRAPAYNVVVKDNLLSNNLDYISSVSIAARYANGTAITGLNFNDLFTASGLNFTALYPIYGVNSTNNTIIITYNATLNSTVYPNQVINNTAQITKFTSLPIPESPNFVNDPTKYQSSAYVQVRDVAFNKSYLGSQGGPSSFPNLTIGEKGTFRLAVTLPAGQINNLTIRDFLPSGLSYISYAIDTAGYSGILAPWTVSSSTNSFNITFNGATNTTSNSTFYINITVMANNNTPYPGSTNVTAQNNATMDWTDPGHVTKSSNATLNIIQPLLIVTKTFTPSIGAGGQNVVVTLNVRNTGSSTAYNVVITDPLSGSNNIFDLSTVTSYNQNGFIYSFPSNVVTFTGGNITPGQNLTFFFNATVLNNVVIGPIFNNTAYATYYSLLNGTSPDLNARNYTASGWATFRAGDPVITKTVVNSSIHGSSGNLAVGEIVTYRITIHAPKGQATNVRITDLLPDNFGYIDYTLNNATWNGTLGNLVVTQNGRNILFNFTGLTTSLSDNNSFYIDIRAVVLNQSVNQVGNIKINNVSLTWDENNAGPINSSASTTIVGPSLSILKTVTPSTVDGSDLMNISLRVINTGNSPAFEVKITDILNTTLFNLSSFTFTPVAGYNITLIGDTITITGNTGTFIDNVAGNNTIYFNFTVNATSDVPSNSTFTNQANGTYYSMPSTFSERRASSAASNIVNINTVNPAIAKTIEATYLNLGSNRVAVGDIVTYRLNFTIPNGKTINVSLIDNLLANLGYIPGSAQILRNNDNITATGFAFSGTNVWQSINPTSTSPLTFSLGNVTFIGINGLQNGTISLIFNATVLNVTANRNGTSIGNNGTLNFTNGNGTTRSYTGVGPNITVVEPRVQIVKTATPTNVDGGNVVTINLTANNTGSAPAYQLRITDLLDTTLFDPATFTPTNVPGYTFLRVGNLITISANNGTALLNGFSQLFTFNVTVRNDVPANSTFANIANIFFSSMPEGFNQIRNYTNSSGVVNFTTPTPSVSKVITGTSEPGSTGNNVLIGEVVTYRINITIPEGSTLNASIRDILNSNLIFNSGTLLMMRSNNSITSTGFDFSSFPEGVYVPISDSFFNLNALNINFGNITYSGINGLRNGTISIMFNATVANIIGNQNGTQIPNSATFNFTNATNFSRSLTASTSNLTTITPQLSAVKTANKSSIQGGETVTYTIIVRNSASAGARAYDIIITDYLPIGMLFSGIVTLPSGWTIDATNSSNVIFTAPVGFNITPGQNVTLEFNATAVQDIKYNATLNNTVNATGTSLPGPRGTNNATPGNPGTSNGERTGDNGPGGLNNIFATANTVVTVRSPTISKSSANNTAPIGYEMPYTIIITVPVGYTDELVIQDFFPTGLNYKINSASISTSAPGQITFGTMLVSGTNPVIFNLGSINATVNGTITISYLGVVQDLPSINNGTTLTNNVTLFYSDPRNPGQYINGGNSTKTITVVEPLLEISKTSDKTNYIPGESVIFTLNLNHATGSTSAAYNIRISDIIPAGLTYQTGSSVLPFGWLVDESQAALNILTFYTNSTTAFLLGQNAIINFTCTAGNYTFAGQNLTNNAGMNYTSVFNETTARSYGPVNASATVHIIGADVYVSKTTSTPTLYAGEPFSYSIRVGNNGPDTAINVKLNDLIDTAWFGSLSGVQYRLNGTWYDFTNNMTIDLGNITSGSFLDILLNGTVSSGAPVGIINNTATVNSTTADPYPQNNNSTSLINVQQQVNITVTKTGPAAVLAGNQINYNITVKNNGPSDARNVHVTDNLPVILTSVQYSTDGGLNWINWPPIMGYIDLGTITAGNNSTIIISGIVPSNTTNGTILNNTVNATSTTPGSNSTNDNWTTTVNTLANLNVVKIGVPDPVVAGEEINYTISVENKGPSDALNVRLTDSIPSQLYNVQYSINSGTYQNWPPVGYIDLGTLIAGETKFVHIKAMVNASTLNGTSIFNSVIISSNTTSLGGNLTDNCTNNVTTVANLTITKNGSPNPVIAGENLLYTITITNNGPSDARNVIISDDVTAFLNNVNYSKSPNIGSGTWTGTLNIGTLQAGHSFVLTLNGTVLPYINSTITNIAYVSSPTDPNAQPHNPKNATCTTDVNTVANLTLNKSNDPLNIVIAGNILIYSVSLVNNGPSVARDVMFYDNSLSSYYLSRFYRYSINGGAWSAWTGFSGPLVLNVTNSSNFPAGYMNIGDNFTVEINGTINASTPNGTVINNTANVTSSTSPFEVISNTVTNQVQTLANLEISKTVDQPVVVAGTAIHYTVTVKNNGPSDAQNVVVNDLLPVYVTGNFYSLDGSNWVNWTSIINLGTLVNGTIQQIWINGTVDPAAPNGTVLNNTVNVTSPTDPNVHEAWAVSTVDTKGDIILLKNNSPSSSVIAGNNLIYQIFLSNTGPSVARDVVLHDNTLSSWLINRYYRYKVNNGSWSSWIAFNGNLMLNVTNSTNFPSGYLGVGENFTVEINSTVNASTPNGTIINNTANLTSSTSPFEVTSNTVTNNVETLANLSISKNGPQTVTAGNSISYVITVKNEGPSDAQDVRVMDALPSYVTGLYYSLDNWATWAAWPPLLGYISLNTMLANETRQIWINGTVDPATPNGTVLNNTANVTSPTDPNSHEAWFTTNVDTKSNMVLTKSDSPDPVVAGETVLYTMVLTNNGPSVARDLIFHDNLPNRLINAVYRYRLNSDAWGTWTNFTGSFQIDLSTGYLNVGDNVTVEINATVNSTTPNGTVIPNYANVTSTTDPFEVISPPVDTTVITRANLTLTKVDEPDPVLAGRELIYTMVLTNNGPSAAWDVIFRDDSISSLLINRYYRYSINGGSWSNWIGFSADLLLNVTNSTNFPAGFMGVGENFRVQINATVNSSTPNGTVLTNYANVTSSTDPNGITSPTVDTTVNTLANLVITKVADVEKIIRGYPVHYTITITNLGPSDALNVNFYDDYDPKILLNTYYSTSTGINWTAFDAPLNLTNLVAALAPGNNITIWINGTVSTNASQNLTNTAITNSETDPAGNKTAQVITPIQTSNVSIEKTVSNPRPYVHETIYFTLIVQNWGPDTAIDVYVIDKLPDGVKYVSYTANYGSYDPNTGIWTIGNLPKDTIAQMVITVVVEKVGPLENHAHVYTASWDPILDDQSSSVSIEVLPQPVQGKTVGMKNTGMPLPLMILAILAVLAGLIRSKRK